MEKHFRNPVRQIIDSTSFNDIKDFDDAKDMLFLGISAFYHDAAAALIRDDEILADPRDLGNVW